MILCENPALDTDAAADLTNSEVKLGPFDPPRRITWTSGLPAVLMMAARPDNRYGVN